MWLRQLTSDLGCGPTSATLIGPHEDNQSAICMAQIPEFHGRTTHVSIKYHFVRDQVDEGTVELQYCKSENMLANVLTKGLPREQFERLRKVMSLKQME